YFSQTITHVDSIINLVKKQDHVVAASPAIYEKGMISSTRGKQAPTAIKAIDPKTAGEVTDFADKVVLGSLDLEPRYVNGRKLPAILLGKYLADDIYAHRIGDSVSVWTMPKQGGLFSQPRVKYFYVAGIVEVGYYEYDKVYSYMRIEEAQDLFQMGNGVSLIEIKLDNYKLADQVAEKIEEELGYPYKLITWFQLNRSLYSWMEIEKWGSFIILSLIIMVAAFNIISSLIMVVMEKTREIGILKSMGASAKSIMKIFVFEGMLVGVIGTILGNIIGYSLGFLQLHYGLVSLPSDVYLIDSLPIVLELPDFFMISSVAIFLSFVASFYPAYKASKLIPVDAIRYE
ncbi:MAG: ABC transporter permease, partial [Calditrichaceae bacterium]